VHGVRGETEDRDSNPGSMRRVQRTGGSSLAVTLPKAWTDAMKVHAGTALRFNDLGEGRLEISLVPSESRTPAGQRLLRIDATRLPPNLLSRLLIGAYVTGQDRVQLTAQGGLSVSQRQEVGRTAGRILGMSIVAESPVGVEVQNFVDPTKYHLSRIVDQVVRMLRAELETCRQALSGNGPKGLAELPGMEEEIDRLYLLMVRQLLIASDDFRVAREIGVENHHYQMGYRVVVKMLEEIGDLLSRIGRELEESLPHLQTLPRNPVRDLCGRLQEFDGHLVATMEAFTHLSITQANATLNVIGEDLPNCYALSNSLARRVRDAATVIAVQRIVSNLIHATQMLVIVNEITINRAVEPETVAKTGGQVSLNERQKA
jgi:phosphate uptake regulator